MRRIILILILIFFPNQVSGQIDSTLFFDVLGISLNRTYAKDDNTENRFGFGLSMYHIFMDDEKVNLLFGVEYNRNSQFKKYIYNSHFSNSNNVTFSINNLSFPISLRLNLENKIKFFIEAGVFADVIVSARMKGIRYSNYPNQNNQIISSESTFNEKADINNLNYGSSMGIGIRIPISEYELTIKTNYKKGLAVLYDYTQKVTNSYIRIMIGFKI
jgi:hypothetical protein